MSADSGSSPFTRSGGVLLHVTSLPSGRLGRDAFAFVDWLAAAGQRWWQVLPIAPPDRYGSPYKAASAFAAWPGLLAAPRARVTKAQLHDFSDREASWAPDWARLARGRRDDLLADQVRFDREWTELREYAADRGVRLLGDIAIYVAPGSVDHRAHPEMFSAGAVAGVPPDAFTELGQLWGNPLYDWPYMRTTGYEWWVARLRRTLALFDAARLDHFRGFVAYWAVPEDASDARSGQWRRGPGRALFDAFAAGLGGLGSVSELPLVAEDLGVITPAVASLRDELALPGMVVLQFGFEPGAETRSPHAFNRHVRNRFAYTGTHDHDTARGWYDGLDAETRARVEAVFSQQGVPGGDPWWRLVDLCHRSVAEVAIVQAQDILGLGSSARMNDPGRRGGNWHWRMASGALTAPMAARLREITEASGRVAGG